MDSEFLEASESSPPVVLGLREPPVVLGKQVLSEIKPESGTFYALPPCCCLFVVVYLAVLRTYSCLCSGMTSGSAQEENPGQLCFNPCIIYLLQPCPLFYFLHLYAIGLCSTACFSLTTPFSAGSGYPKLYNAFHPWLLLSTHHSPRLWLDFQLHFVIRSSRL